MLLRRHHLRSWSIATVNVFIYLWILNRHLMWHQLLRHRLCNTVNHSTKTFSDSLINYFQTIQTILSTANIDLFTQLTLLSAQLSLISNRFDKVQAVVSLYQALGGGRE